MSSENTLAQNPQWIVFDTTNSELPANMIYCLSLDNDGNKWMGIHTYTGLGFNTSGDGLVEFDGTDWTLYDTLNSDIHTNTVRCISIDQSDNKWIGTGWVWTGWEFIRERGIVKFDGLHWTVYDPSNSGLRDYWINCIVIDQYSNKWIGTGWGGLAVFNESGVVSIERDKTYQGIIPTDYLLYQNYPNPFNPSTKIEFSIQKPENVRLEVYNIIGQKIETLFNKHMPAGNHEVEFNAQNQSNGVYFYRIEAGEFQDVKKMVLVR